MSIKKNPCHKCGYYNKENNTCQSKKCCTGTDGYITFWDRLFCEPYILKAEGEEPYRTRYEVGEEHPVAYEIEAEGE